MQVMMDFVLWFIQEFPAVLLEPPISAFTGLCLLFATCSLFRRMIHL